MENEQKSLATSRSTCAQVHCYNKETLGLVLAFSALNWFPINVGLIISMPVIINGALRTEQSGLTFTEEDASWFSGLIYIMQPLGSVICGFLQDILGRKTCFMLICIPQLVAWTTMYFGSSVAALFVASGTLGFTMGFMEAPIMSYISEITEPHLRDRLASVSNVSFNVGILVLFFVGALVDWRTMVLISALGPVIAFLSVALVPDSPAWLVSRDRVEDAHRALQWLRGWVNPESVQQEMDAVVAFVLKNRELKAGLNKGSLFVIADEGSLHGKEILDSDVQIFFHPNIQRPMRLILVYFLAGNCASLLPIRSFFIEILDNIGLPLDSRNIMAIGGALTLLGSLTATLVMHRFGIRGLTFMSLSLCVISCLSTGLYLLLNLNLPWIPLTLIFISFYAGPLGVLFIPWILISELFPLRGKGFASGVTAALVYLMMFIITKTYYSLVSTVQLSGALLIYGLVGFLGLIYLFFTLPETEGIPLDVIQQRLARGREKESSVCQVEVDATIRTSRNVDVII